jgi:hypothetical protein
VEIESRLGISLKRRQQFGKIACLATSANFISLYDNVSSNKRICDVIDILLILNNQIKIL